MRTHLMLAGVLLTASAIGAAVPAGAQTPGSPGDQPPPVAVTGGPTPTPAPVAPSDTVAPRSPIPSQDSDYQPGLSSAAPTTPSATVTVTVTTASPATSGAPADGETLGVSAPAPSDPTDSVLLGTGEPDGGATGLEASFAAADDGPAPKRLPSTGPARNAAPLGAALLAAGLSWIAAARRPCPERPARSRSHGRASAS